MCPRRSGRRDFGTEHELHGLADEAQLQQLLEVPGAEVELITAYELVRVCVCMRVLVCVLS
mgnify:CR=1 FL=1